MRRGWSILSVLILWLSASCSVLGTETTTPVQPDQTPTAVPASPVPATSTPSSPVGIVLVPLEAEPSLVKSLEPLLREQIQERGLRYQQRESLGEEDFQRDEIQWVFVFPPVDDLMTIVESAPDTNFLAIGFSDLEPAENLSVIRSGNDDYAVQGFIAGYIAAMITPDWRVAAVGIRENPAAQQAREAFVAGAKYYCGLCLPKYAPTGENYLYPKYIEFPPEAGQAERQASVQVLLNRAVETFYIVPGAGDPALYEFLMASGANLIGSGKDYQSSFGTNWVASLTPNFELVLEGYLLDFLAGETGKMIQAPLEITDVNPELLSPGRLLNARRMLEKIEAGWVSPSSSE